jgi:hypothetical protein
MMMASTIPKHPDYRRIATAEAWAPAELLKLYRRELAEKAIDDPGFHSLWDFFGGSSDRARLLVERIQDLGERRLADMDSTGIDRPVVSITSPGVQIFENFSLHDQRHRLRTAHMYVHAVMGADRLPYEMDYPYQFVAEEVVVQDNLPLDAGDKRKIFQNQR